MNNYFAMGFCQSTVLDENPQVFGYSIHDIFRNVSRFR